MGKFLAKQLLFDAQTMIGDGKTDEAKDHIGAAIHAIDEIDVGPEDALNELGDQILHNITMGMDPAKACISAYEKVCKANGVEANWKAVHAVELALLPAEAR